jgi:hypothetical protein
VSIAAVLGASTVEGQLQMSASALKAAYLFNFARFVEWPPEALPVGGPFTMCIGDGPVASSLREIVSGRSVEDHAIVVRDIVWPADVRSCQVLYIDGLDATAIDQVVEGVREAHVLTVGDADRFTTRGGVAHFFVDSGRMRVAINRTAAERAGLRVSSRLLALAKLVP